MLGQFLLSFGYLGRTELLLPGAGTAHFLNTCGISVVSGWAQERGHGREEDLEQ